MDRARIEAAKKLFVIGAQQLKESGGMNDKNAGGLFESIKEGVPGLTQDELLQAVRELVPMFEGQPENAVLTTVLVRKPK